MSEKSKWQPIDTAPRDETRVLGWDGKERCIIHYYGGLGWIVSHDVEGYAWADYKPTHWTPVPDPPKEAH